MKREEREIQYDERINRYLRGLMGDEERAAFEQEVDGNEELRERLISTSLLVQSIAEEGMDREGQYQLDAISRMTPEEFEKATMGEPQTAAASQPKAPKRSKTLFWWASGIAASIVLAVGLFLNNPTTSQQPSEMADNSSGKPATSKKVVPTPAQPMLASLAAEYNKPIAGESDEFVAIRQQIQNEDAKDMMAVVYDIDKIQAPTSNEGAMGAENADVVKEMRQMHNDCTHWYRALAFLKKGDKDSAVKELNNVKEHGSNEDLVKRATDLLKKLEK